MTPHFDASTPEEAIAGWVDSCKLPKALLPLLPEQHPLYAGRSTNEAGRIRGFIVAAFARTGLPDGALPFVLEELESGLHPYLVAAAARALRGAKRDPAYASFLRKAERNIRYNDAPVTFDAYNPRWPFPNPTTAMEEIRKTLAWLGAARDCCMPLLPDRARRTADPDVDLEDQDGRRLRFGDFFRGQWSVVAFFYTRCDNPEKCSLTITKLGRLQTAIESGPLRSRVRLAAITYDPLYDLPSRMRAFGENRGVRFDGDVRFFRAPNGLDRLRACLDLGVNFAGSIVNRHRLELYVLNERGETVATFSRMQWDVAAVVDELQSQLSKPRWNWRGLWTSIPPLSLALLPKCPLCLGAYLSLIGLSGLQAVFRSPWTTPLLIVVLLLSIWVTYRRSRQSHGIVAPALALTGTTALLAGSVLWNAPFAAIGGAALLIIASLLGISKQQRPA